MHQATDPYARALENKKRKLREMPISSHNCEAIVKFSDHCFSEGLCCRRVLKYVYTLAVLAGWMPRDFDEASREDIEELVAKIERSDYAEWTKHDYKVALKKFYRWLKRCEDGYPPEVKWIRSTMRKSRTKLPEDILTPQEVQSMISAATTARDRALLAVLYESGCRIGELIGLQIRHVHQHPHGLQITVTGKKGPRRLLLIASVTHLTAWLNEHPHRGDPQASLWVSNDYRVRHLTCGRIRTILQRMAKRAGVRKAVNPHNFRHSRATHLANHLTEAQMNEYMGWVQGSDMASTYVHLSGRDVDRALLKLNNIQVSQGEDSANGLSPRTCPRCDLRNPPSNRFCSRCGGILDEKAAHEIMSKNLDRGRADQIMDTLLEDAEFREVLQRKLTELDHAGFSRRTS